MITEDYVSFEVAKLLKEKGFNEPTFTYYNNNGELMNSCHFCGNYTLGCFNVVKDEKVNCAAPTHQMVMKWLREVHRIIIIIQKEVYTGSGNWWCRIDRSDRPYIDSIESDADYESYELAAEAAILYCLENLI